MKQATIDRDRAVLLIIGDELLVGAHPDLNGPFLARQLAELGVRVYRLEVVGDIEAEIEVAVRRARADARYVFVCGGLGPTLDDVTRHGVASAFGVALCEDDASVEQLRVFFARLERPFPDANKRQALFPETATIVPNAAGTAPAFRVEREDVAVVVFPGPPREVEVVWREEVAGWLRAELGDVSAEVLHRMALFGVSESAFADSTGDLMDRGADPLVGCSAKQGTLYLTLRSAGAGAHERLEAGAATIRRLFGPEILTEGYSGDHLPRVEDVLGALLLKSGTTISLAESCTGGGAAASVTAVPGISAVFERSYVTYSNAAKVELLGVPESVLLAHGAVSADAASAMAEGVVRAAGSQLGISISGVAGPGSGSPDKPVGTIFVGLHLNGVTTTLERRYPASWGRAQIRAVAARLALHQALLALRKELAGPSAKAPLEPAGESSDE